ncbi:HAD-IA family hydrolase [Shewanella sp. A3A]|nr:HAD-IA family hydrolase [Shewanella ferrihydritica]
MGINKVEAVIFDLDDTLVSTSKLEEYRKSNDRDGLERNLDKSRIFQPVHTILEEIANKGIKLALVTNSPRWYVDKLLSYHQINVFETIIAYDDVGATGIKPSPYGINLALEKLGITNPNRCIYIGDQASDFNAAYSANVKPVAPCWATRHAIEQVPAAIINSETLIDSLDDYDKIGLIADQVAFHRSLNFPKKQLNFAPLNEDGNIVPLDKDKIKLITFGRYFSQGSELTARYHETHKLSQDIYAKELSETYVIPQYWVDLIEKVVSSLPLYFLKNENSYFDIITVIPSKKGKNKRLENLLKRVEALSDSKSSFVTDIFEFKDGAKSLKTLGGKDARKRELELNLFLKDKYKNCLNGKSILVIDDVITTGSTFNRAFEILNTENAAISIGVSIAKTVSIRDENKICPKCNSVMKVRLNKKTNIHFWGCSAFFETGNRKCNYSEPIKIKECPICGKDMVMQYNPKNGSSFLTCSSYRTASQCGHTECVSEI